jgi:polyphosphate glucokinase
MELAHLPYKKGTYEDYVGERSLEKRGKKKWRRYVADVVERLTAALEPDDVVLGGGNVTKLKELPKGTRVGNNNNAFLGGFRLWENAVGQRRSRRAKGRNIKKRKDSKLKIVTGSKSAATAKRS